MNRLWMLLATTLIVGCSGHAPSILSVLPAPHANEHVRAMSVPSSGIIQHVIIVIQENRSVDNLFMGFPGADTATSGLDSQNKTVQLHHLDLVADYDMNHSHFGFTTEYDNGEMNGFDQDPVLVKGGGTPPPDAAYRFVPRSEVQPYWIMARRFAFADRMFQTNASASFPAHQYLISGTAAVDSTGVLYAMENPLGVDYAQLGGCDSPAGTTVQLINPLTNDQSQYMFPCFDHETLADLLMNANLSWAYYQAYIGPGLWEPFDAISHIRYNAAAYANVLTPSKLILKDVAQGNLRAVSWVSPTAKESDHSTITDGSGPDWVASIVNAVGESQYWDSTVIFVIWDDWGGWYDHVPPPQYNYYELGLRVPLIAISAYAKKGYVSHVQHEFGSVLNFVEETFGLPCKQAPPNCGALGYTDMRADDLSDMFDFTQKPRAFHAIPAGAVTQAEESDTRKPDDDF